MSDDDSDVEDTTTTIKKAKTTTDGETLKNGSTDSTASTKEKCKYWDKCFRKNAKHLKDFEHPGDKSDAGNCQLTELKVAVTEIVAKKL